MRCPWCRAQVTVIGRRWECGLCGNRGELEMEPEQLQTLDTRDVPLIWKEICGILEKLVPGDHEQRYIRLNALVVYEITRTFKVTHRKLTEEKKQYIEGYMSRAAGEKGPMYAEQIFAAIQRNAVLCATVGVLTKDSCGTFWSDLIQNAAGRDRSAEHAILCRDLSLIFANFSGEFSGGKRREKELAELLDIHINRNRCLHPDVDAAIERLQADNVSQFDRDCRDILIFSFPEIFQNYSSRDMETIHWESLLRSTLYTDPILAVSMWNVLLDASGLRKRSNQNVYTRLWNASLFPIAKWNRFVDMKRDRF